MATSLGKAKKKNKEFQIGEVPKRKRKLLSVTSFAAKKAKVYEL